MDGLFNLADKFVLHAILADLDLMYPLPLLPPPKPRRVALIHPLIHVPLFACKQCS